jgi:hypothetical protein
VRWWLSKCAQSRNLQEYADHPARCVHGKRACRPQGQLDGPRARSRVCCRIPPQAEPPEHRSGLGACRQTRRVGASRAPDPFTYRCYQRRHPHPRGTGGELEALEAKKQELPATRKRLVDLVPRLHPRLADLYREKVARLRDELNRSDIRTKAVEVIPT